MICTFPVMSFDRSRRGGAPGTGGTAHTGPSSVVGKRTLTMDLPPPMAKPREASDAAAEVVQKKSAGAPLPSDLQSKMEPALGTPLGGVRVHDDAAAGAASSALSARAFAHGSDIFLGRGESASDTRLVAHEVAHVAQQAGQPATAQAKLGVGAVDDPLEAEADRVADAVVSGAQIPAVSHGAAPMIRRAADEKHPGSEPPGGAEPGGKPVDASGDKPVKSLADAEIGPALAKAEDPRTGSPQRAAEIEAELEIRVQNAVVEGEAGSSPWRPGNAMVKPEVAAEILENLAKGEPPFKPELGKGGASWFVTEGTPYTGTGPEKTVSIAAEIDPAAKPIQFSEPELVKLFEKAAAETPAEAEAAYRAYLLKEYKIPVDSPLNSKGRKGLARFQKDFAESRMWDAVAKEVAASPDGVGEVTLVKGSRFSRSGSGKFGVVTDAKKIRIKGGMEALLKQLGGSTLEAKEPVPDAAAKLAKQRAWAGRVRGVFQYGSRVLLVVQIGAEAWKIYHAENKVKAIIESVGGWAGASAGAATFAALFVPADVAGPLAWLLHGAGTLVAGGVGYWIGSETTRTVYELVLEN